MDVDKLQLEVQQLLSPDLNRKVAEIVRLKDVQYEKLETVFKDLNERYLVIEEQKNDARAIIKKRDETIVITMDTSTKSILELNEKIKRLEAKIAKK